jgi:hypothetical protein
MWLADHPLSQIPTSATGFRQSDIKIRGSSAVELGYQQTPMPGDGGFPQPCKNEEFKSRKRFTVLKTVNYFLKIKEAFTVKQKMISVDHYFRFHQTPKNAKNIFPKYILRRNKRSIR